MNPSPAVLLSQYTDHLNMNISNLVVKLSTSRLSHLDQQLMNKLVSLCFCVVASHSLLGSLGPSTVTLMA